MSKKLAYELGTSEFNPDRDVYVSVFFNHGGVLNLRTIEKRAQESLRQWKKSQLFYTKSIEEQKAAPVEDRPWYLYHWMIGDESKPETLRPVASIILPAVIGIAYAAIIEDDKQEQMEIMHKEFVDLTLKKLRAELRNDAWKDKE